MNAEMVNLPCGGKRLVVEFSGHDLVKVHLDKFDHAMLREPSVSVADWLLDAELIARRLEEQFPPMTAQPEEER